MRYFFLLLAVLAMTLIYHLGGNEELAKTHVGEAQNRLFVLKQRMTLGKQQQGFSPYYRLDDGTIFRVSSVYGMDRIEIVSPFFGGEKKVVAMSSEKWHTVFCGYNQVTGAYNWRVNKTKQDGATEWDSYMSGGGYFNSAYKIALDEKANVITVGESFRYFGGAYSDWARWTIEKRNKSGELVWVAKEDTGSIIDVSADKTGIYVVGRGFDSVTGGVASGSYVQVEKRDKADGTLIWQKKYDKIGTYDRAIACAVAKDYLYVSAYALWGSSPQYQQGRVLSINKNTGEIESTFYGDLSSSPFPRSSMYEIAVTVKDVEKTGTSNAIMMTDRWIKTLGGELLIDIVYGSVSVDHLTLDKNLSADKTGIYTVGQVPDVSSTYYGYEVAKWDYEGNQVWATVYDVDAGFVTGPFLSDISIDDKYVYVSGFKKQSGYTRSIRQALDKNTGEIVWTQLDAPSPYSYLWGVASTVITTELTREE